MAPTRPPRWRLLPALAGLLLAGAATLATAPAAHAATQICAQYGSATVAGGRYIVQNNEWNDSITQCITPTDDGFTYDSGYHNLSTSGAPAAYPSIYAGCHYGNCTSNSGLPLQVSSFGNVTSSAAYTTTSGSWDAAYDIWFDPTPNPPGQNYGAEIMVWGNHSGPPQPVGSKVGTATLAGATWDVWEGNIGWNVISYVRQQTTNNLSISVKDFTYDAVHRGYVQTAWYLTSVQFGFEPWQGGPGLAVNSFAFSTNGTSTGQSIVGQGSGRCVDIQNAATADGTATQLWDCSGAANQKWNYTGGTFVNPASSKCLDVASGSTANGAQVRLWTCNGTGAQQWQVNGNGTITNPQSGKCLDAVGQGTANGTLLQIYDCYGGGGTQANQVWSLR